MDKYSITSNDFAQLYRDGQLDEAYIMDVREPYEWEMYHLEKARLLPMNSVPEHLDQLDKDQTVYVVCAHGVRSWHVTNYLLRNGFDKVVNVEGGMAEVALHLNL
ncbi:rhodanese-like domain-containing protein [Aneurinibacillus tyrosinisolvens]|jgi:rhodanese-related sulfurtransferase|uniref:rhodanese-like domain-containing protein n=1 Tax=Aneurinibacillus tyrosinisolvens TaxID=1443435 RepID=UPI00069C840D|nr:rhodanese-like domain-containing protein [Aneurinibacillus tyrosinisolvens]